MAGFGRATNKAGRKTDPVVVVATIPADCPYRSGVGGVGFGPGVRTGWVRGRPKWRGVMGMYRRITVLFALSLMVAVVVPASSSAATPTCNGVPATIVGTPGNDRIDGTDGDDVIVARGGHDYVRTLGGDDLVCAGAGDDYVTLGEAGTVFGGAGDDQMSIYPGDGAVRLYGGPGDDDLSGGNGPDLLIGATTCAATAAPTWSIAS